MSVDNPYYFFNEVPTKVEQPSKGFSFFRRRSSSSSSTKSIKSPKPTFNSTTLNPDILGRKGSIRSLLRPNGSGTKEPCLSNGFSTVGYRSEQNHYRNRLGSYNESSNYHENDDVFVSPRNNTQPTSVDTIDGPMSCGIRRHSIGTFVGRDKRCGSISDEVPKTYAPKPPVQMQNSLNSKVDRKASDAYGMDDILIVTSRQSEPAILWANFLKTRFDKITKQRGRQPFNFLHIKIDEIPITSDIAKRCQSTKLQIVILCSSLIALPSHFLMSQLSVLLKPDIVLGILLEVSEDKILEIHKNALPSFKKWRRCVVKNHDQSLVGNVLGIATDILGRALCQRPVCSDTNPTTNKTCPNEAFTVLPRKVKLGQNKVVALLNEPLMKDDWIKIKIDKSGEMIEILNFKKRNPYTLQFSIPDSCMEVSTMIEIRIMKNEKELGSRPVKCESRLRELEHILKSQESPLEFMCHSLGITNSDRNALDAYLSQTFQKNVPPNFHLLSATEPVKNSIFRVNKENSSEEYPTLLHFAAKWGLEHLCMQLMECPGGETACELRNHAGKTPPELAESSGFVTLSATLRSFMQMHEFTTMYHYFKGITDSTTSTTQVMIEEKPFDASKLSNLDKKQNSPPISTDGYMEMSGSDQDSSGPINAVTNLNYINVDNYAKDEELNKNFNDAKITDEPEIMTNEMKILEPDYFDSNETNKTDQFSQECSNLLENCSSMNSSNESQSDYLLQPSNIPVISGNHKIENTFGDYLTQPSNRPVELKTLCENADYQMQPSNRKVLYSPTPIDIEQSHLKLNFKKSNKSLVKSDTSSKSSADDELLEIMNDFKNHVFTIQEVEQLVMSWKNRNDVKQSDKERQVQLEKMRCEYERIQAQMKEKMKRPTPFDRMKIFKKLFFRNKSSSSDDGNADVADETKSHRPMSSLSLQSISSSSSSGRMSTGSACSGASLGDSGTHSDHEERRPVFSNTFRVGLPGSLMDNYLIPPTPRPVVTPASTPVDEKPQPTFGGSKFDVMENYSMFPSNIPVHQQAVEHHTHHDYMNFSGLNTIEETKENEVTVQPIKVQKPDSLYGSIAKRPSDLCTSFKPNFLTNPTVVIKGDNVNYKKDDRNGDIVLSKENINEIYKNLNELDAKIQENNQKIVINECHSSFPNDNCDNANDRMHHEYMNVNV